MLDWTIAISRCGSVASLLLIALGGVGFAQATVPLPPASTTAAASPPSSAAKPPAASPAPLLTSAQLAQLVAPIALYPDPLLAQILMASTYPLEVVEAARWVKIPARRATSNRPRNAIA